MALTPEQVAEYRTKYGINTAPQQPKVRTIGDLTADFSKGFVKGAVGLAADTVRLGFEGAKATNPSLNIVSEQSGLDTLLDKGEAGLDSMLAAESGAEKAGKITSTVASVLAPTPKIGMFRSLTSKGMGAVDTAVDTVAAGASSLTQKAAPATDIAKGLVTQGADFVRRVASNAQEAAGEARKMAKMPEPVSRFVRAGGDERAADLITKASPEERSLFRQAVDLAKTKEGALDSKVQPKEVAGRAFMEPVNFLLKQRDSVGAKLGAVRQKLSTQKIDINPQFREFQRFLTENYGLLIDKSGNLMRGAGRVADSDMKEIQRIYDDLRPTVLGGAKRSQKWIDEWSQRTFKEYDLRQAREKTFSDDVTRVAEKARSTLKKAMPDEYNKLSTTYAETMRPIQEVVKLLGYKGDIDKLSTKELKAGEVALRVLGNASSRPQEVIDAVLTAAKSGGFKSKVDMNKIITFVDKLEDLYDITPSRGFSGSATRGINQSDMTGIVSDVATMNVPGMASRALNSAPSQKELKEAFEALLKSLD